MKKSLKLIAGIIMLSAVLVSCGQKKSIWKVIGDRNTISASDIMEAIKSGKYDLNAFSEDGKTVLTAFLSKMNDTEYEMVISNGADLNLADNNGNYPLFEAVKGDEVIARKVIENVKDVNVKNKDGFNVLYELKSHYNIDYLNWLLERGIDTNDYNNFQQPFIDLFANDPGDVDLIKYIMSDKFELKLQSVYFDNYIGPFRKSLDYIEKSKNTLFVDDYSFRPENKISMEPAEGKCPFMPSLYTTNDFILGLFKERNVKFYLMKATSDGNDGYVAGTEVTINGYAEPKIVNVDGVNCYNYNVTVSGSTFDLPGRYISMYSSEMDIDGDGKNELLLSNYYLNNFNYENSNDFTFIELGDMEDYDTEVVLVKNSGAYFITMENNQKISGTNNFEFTEGGQITNIPVIVSTSFSSPVDTYYHFYTLCGTELIPICTEDIYWEGDGPVYDEFTKYEFVKEYNKLYLNFIGITRMLPDEEEFEITYKQAYFMTAPFVWTKNVGQ